MRRPRNFQTDRYYHLVNRVGHRAFYLDEYEPWHEVTPPLPLHQWGQTLWRSQPTNVDFVLDTQSEADGYRIYSEAEGLRLKRFKSFMILVK